MPLIKSMPTAASHQPLQCKCAVLATITSHSHRQSTAGYMTVCLYDSRQAETDPAFDVHFEQQLHAACSPLCRQMLLALAGVLHMHASSFSGHQALRASPARHLLSSCLQVFHTDAASNRTARAIQLAVGSSSVTILVV